MKKIISAITIILLLGTVVQSCCKNCNMPNPPNTDTVYKTKTNTISWYFGSVNSQPYETTNFSYTYDAQNRPLTVQANDVNNSSGSTVNTATLIKISYSQGAATYSYFINGAATASFQTIYYLNASSLIDSAVHQYNVNNAWATFERESYAGYNPDGNATIADTTFYDQTTNALDSTSNNSITWTGFDLTSFSNQNSNGNTYSATYTYYNKPPAKVVSLLSGPAYVKGVNRTNNWAETINTFINGNPFSNWSITYQTDDLNRTISTNFTINIISPASTFYEVTTFTYY